MKKEEKKLLLKDLFCRLPYGVKIYLEDFPNATLVGVVNDGIILHCDKYDYTYDTPWDIEYIKPYLFPMSSMTEEQSKMYHELIGGMFGTSTLINFEALEDFFHKNHIDYRGLIEKGLAIEITKENNPYKE